MSDDRIGHGFASGPRQITTERVGGWDEIVVVLRITLALMIEAGSGVVLLWLSTLVAGPWALMALVPGAIVVADRWLSPDKEPWQRPHRWDLAACGVLVGIILTALPEGALIWWPWVWQINRATWWGLLWPRRWPQLIAATVLLRVVVIAVAMRMKAATWYLVQRLRQESIAPTATGAAYNAADLHNLDVRGYQNPHRNPESEPEVQPHSYGDIIIDGVEALPQPARVLAADPVSGDPSVAIGGNGGGRHTAQARIPTSLLGGDRQHVRDLLRILHDVYGALADGEQLSRANLQRHGLSEPQARTLSGWFRDQGYATLDRANNHQLTEAGERYLGVTLGGLVEARRRIE